MSDGNFNRNLLPYNNYRSGHKAGQAQMKAKAVAAFAAWYANAFPAATAEQIAAAQREYVAYIDAI